MKKIFIFSIICLSLGCGYAYSVRHPHSIRNELSYLCDKVKDKTTGSLIRVLIKCNLSAKEHNADYIYTNNLYDVDYDIITDDDESNVQVITYGPPTYITSGNVVTIYYDLPDGGQYKRTIPHCTKIKVNKIKKID